MNVKIEGNNIIEGIKKLTDFGVAQAPLPPHLADLHSLAKNYFVIDDSAFNWKKKKCIINVNILYKQIKDSSFF